MDMALPSKTSANSEARVRRILLAMIHDPFLGYLNLTQKSYKDQSLNFLSCLDGVNLSSYSLERSSPSDTA